MERGRQFIARDRGLSGSLLHRAPAGYLAAALGVALVSGLIGLILSRVNIANLSMLYLIVVLAVAVSYGSGPAVAASVLAFLAFNWFFIEPLHTFTVADPAEWLALLVFLLTAIVTGELAASQRRRTEEARRRGREALELYELGRLLGGGIDLDHQLAAALAQLKRALGLRAAAVVLEDEAGRPERRVGDKDLGPANDGTWLFSHGTPGARSEAIGRWVKVRGIRNGHRRAPGALQVPLRAGDREVGLLQLVAGDGPPALAPEQERFLAAAANQMAQAIARDRLDRRARQTEILRRADELKTALLNAVSHDLRTPLALIKASGESLLRRGAAWDPATREEFAATVVREADRLDRLVGNLLDLSCIEAGALRPHRELFPLADLLDDVIDRHQELAAAHPLIADVPEDLPPVPLDYVQIEQVLTNLVENAVKHTPPGTPITLSARPHPDEVVITVADEGPGIDPADLPHIFEPFYRADGSQGTPARGTGLGLAVVKGLVEAHGGRVWTESALGRGTRISFALPLAAAGGAGAGR